MSGSIRRSNRAPPANTPVGAVAGALPVLMGWAAVGGRFGLAAVDAVFDRLPLAVSPLHGDRLDLSSEYAAAGLQMLPVVDPSGRRAGVQAVLSALALVPVSLLPAVSMAGGAYFGWALLLGWVNWFAPSRSCWRWMTDRRPAAVAGVAGLSAGGVAGLSG